MIKVPAEIQVRIIRPQPEDAVPRFMIKEIEPPKENPLLKLSKKVLSGGLIGAILGLGIYLALKFCGINFGGVETSIVVGIPSALGIFTSYVIL
jgi:hypothetical protein